MTKHRKVRRTRRQRGGFWPFSSSEPVDPYAPEKPGFFQGIGDFFSSGVKKTEEALGSAGTVVTDATNNAVDTITSIGNTDVPVPFVDQSNNQTGVPATGVPTTDVQTTGVATTGIQGTSGGRRKRRARSMKGGKDGSNLVYYAAPVSGLKVVEPTTWQYYGNGVNQYSVKGGSKKRKSRKSRRTRRHKRR
jgi:hypothetical protein